MLQRIYGTAWQTKEQVCGLPLLVRLIQLTNCHLCMLDKNGELHIVLGLPTRCFAAGGLSPLQ